MKSRILSIFSGFSKENYITAGVIFSCLLLYAVFPTNNAFQQIISSLTFLLAIPLLYVKIILKRSLKEFGIQKGEWKTGLIWIIISLAVAFLILYIFSRYFGFFEKYSVPKFIRGNFFLFVGYEIFLTGFFVALYEIFFRGFIMFSFRAKIGYWSVIVQGAAFFLLFWLSSSMNWTIAPYLIFVLLSGLVAFYSRSIIYSFISNLLFVMIVDSIFIKLVR